MVSISPPSATSVVAFDVGFEVVVGVSLDPDASMVESIESSSSRFRFRVAGELRGGAGRNVYSGWYMIARYQWRLGKRTVSGVGKAVTKSAHCSLIGTTRYFLLNTSTLEVHFRTLS